MTGSIATTLCFVLGTRAEAIKLSSLIAELSTEPRLRLVVIETGQHHHIRSFMDKYPGVDFLQLQKSEQGFDNPKARLKYWREKLREKLLNIQPNLVIVQGDTDSSLAGALEANGLGIRLGHVEAGLTSGLPFRPWPEEENRRQISAVADYHFAPTSRAVQHLLQIGKSSESICLVGNTIMDVALKVANQQQLEHEESHNEKYAILTLHRFESFLASNLVSIVNGVIETCQKLDCQIRFILPINREKRSAVLKTLEQAPSVSTREPLEHLEFLRLLRRSFLIFTDSGGIVEEATFFKKRCIIVRGETERPEALASPLILLSGTNTERIVETAFDVVNKPIGCTDQSFQYTFGDGQAARRIRHYLMDRL